MRYRRTKKINSINYEKVLFKRKRIFCLRSVQERSFSTPIITDLGRLVEFPFFPVIITENIEHFILYFSTYIF